MPSKFTINLKKCYSSTVVRRYKVINKQIRTGGFGVIGVGAYYNSQIIFIENMVTNVFQLLIIALSISYYFTNLLNDDIANSVVFIIDEDEVLK